jgi:hypothetical protein
MSACWRHMSMSVFFESTCVSVNPTQKSTQHTLSITAKKFESVQTYQVHIFDLNCTSWNYLYLTDKPKPRCHVVLDTLANRIFSQVVDMTGTCRRHVANTTQPVGVWCWRLVGCMHCAKVGSTSKGAHKANNGQNRASTPTNRAPVPAKMNKQKPQRSRRIAEKNENIRVDVGTLQRPSDNLP